MKILVSATGIVAVVNGEIKALLKIQIGEDVLDLVVDRKFQTKGQAFRYLNAEAPAMVERILNELGLEVEGHTFQLANKAKH